MSKVAQYVGDIKEKNKADRQKTHTVTITLSEASHELLVKLSEHLQTPKSNLASGLAAAAIHEAALLEFKKELQEGAAMLIAQGAKVTPTKFDIELPGGKKL